MSINPIGVVHSSFKTRSDMKKKAFFDWLPKTKNKEEDYD